MIFKVKVKINNQLALFNARYTCLFVEDTGYYYPVDLLMLPYNSRCIEQWLWKHFHV